MQRKYAKLDVVPGGPPRKEYISEHDENSRHLLYSLFASEGTLDIPEGTTVKLEGTKPDGTELTVNAILDGIGVTVDLPKEAADTAGEIPCKFLLTNGEMRLYTEEFILVADPDVKEA